MPVDVPPPRRRRRRLRIFDGLSAFASFVSVDFSDFTGFAVAFAVVVVLSVFVVFAGDDFTCVVAAPPLVVDAVVVLGAPFDVGATFVVWG